MKKFEGIMQMFLLVVSVIAFAYFVSEGFSGVSAETININGQEIELDSQTQVQMIQWLVQHGVDVGNPDAIANMDEDLLNEFYAEFGEVLGEGTAAAPNQFGSGGNIQGDGINIGSGLFDRLNSLTGGGTAMCVKTKDNKICQEYTIKSCEDECSGECHELIYSGGNFNDVQVSGVPSECELGYCYDASNGICSVGGSPRGKCEEDEGKWYSMTDAEGVELCERHCCVVGNQALFTNKGQCTNIIESSGFEYSEVSGGNAYFDSSISLELECLAVPQALNWGACRYYIAEEDAYGCKFITREECEQRGVDINEDFFEGVLCSADDVDSVCSSMNYTGCVEGLDEVYWFDSCDNRENIFGSDYNSDGTIVSKEDGCVLGDEVANQETCGNCNRLRGSYCGEEIEGQELNDNHDSGFVCRDMGCFEEDGDRRENGETWCAYDSRFGVNQFGGKLSGYFGGSSVLSEILGGAGDRSLDTPGSQHFKASCLNGEITYDRCDEYRNSICVQNNIELSNEKEISQASCRANRWEECYNYNPHYEKGKSAAQMKVEAEKAMQKCRKDPDCVLNTVDVDDDFSFPVCVPKYPPGFDLKVNPEGAEQLCSFGSQKCKVVYVKEITGWECKANCDCVDGKEPGSGPSKTFIQEMNDLCTSLGDCGSSVNYVGRQGTGGYTTKLDDKPIGGAGGGLGNRMDANPAKDSYISSEDSEQWIGSIGGSCQGSGFGLGGGSAGNDANLGTIAAVSGGIGAVLLTGSWIAASTGTAVPLIVAEGVSYTVVADGLIYAEGLTAAEASSGANLVGGTAVAESTGLSITPVAGAIAGAAIAASVTALLIDVLGIGAGLSPAMTYGLIGASAVGGALVTTSILANTGPLAGACVDPAGCIIVVVVIVIILTLKLFGVGDIEEEEITFECQPWQPPRAAYNCESCGEDELSDGKTTFQCSKYACETLGQGCVFIPQEPGGLCVREDRSPNPPQLVGTIPTGNENIEYENFVMNEGFEVRKVEGEEGCFTQFDIIEFGFELDTYGRCSFSFEPDAEFEQMTQLSAGIFAKNHTLRFGALALPDLVAEERKDLSAFIKCEDTSENGNVNSVPYHAEFCVIPLDITAPVMSVSGGNKILVPYGTETEIVRIYTLEPAQLRWDFEDKEYDDMRFEMECSDIPTAQGYLCTAEVPITEGSTRIYVRGKDDDGNTNQGSVIVDIERSESALAVEFVKPEEGEKIIWGAQIVPVNIEVRTSGGYNGQAACYYSVDNSSVLMFKETGAATHKQTFTAFAEGTHNLAVACGDVAGNNVTSEVNFIIEKDLVHPFVTRVYRDGGSFVLVTNEAGECAYIDSTRQGASCSFDFSNGTLMGIVSGSGGLEHSSSFDGSNKYFVKCKDIYENEPGVCSIVVSGGII